MGIVADLLTVTGMDRDSSVKHGHSQFLSPPSVSVSDFPLHMKPIKWLWRPS